jgi:hypothetical protein
MAFDAPTFAASVVVSLLGGGVAATFIAKMFDARAASAADTRADEAADRAAERNLKNAKATQAIERRRAQEETVDKMLGHAWFLLTEAVRQSMQDGYAVEVSLAATTVTDAETGRLTDTRAGESVIVAYARCKDAFRGVELSGGNCQISVPAVQKAGDDLGVAAKRWRDAVPSGPAGQ